MIDVFLTNSGVWIKLKAWYNNLFTVEYEDEYEYEEKLFDICDAV